MRNLLGLPVEKAIARLSEAGEKQYKTERTIAPRGEHTRGTLRVIRINEKAKILTVSLFPDDVKAEGSDEI